MKKGFVCMALTCVMLMSGCSVSKMLYPTVPKAELYYNTVKYITKNDVQKGMYNDLFFNSNLTTECTQNDVLATEKRTMSGQVLNFVDYIPEAGDDNALCTWLKSTICQYGFTGHSEADNKLSYYLVQRLEGNTYDDYLAVMRALTVKYGECTTEVYKKDGYSINTTSVSEDLPDSSKLIEKYNEAYANGEITIESRWVANLYSITVLFADDGSARITYRFNER